VVLSRSVAPACLPPASSDPDQYADKKAIILGWGTAGNEGSQKLFIVQDATCFFFGQF
jgi:hypothetical protein